MFGNTTTAVGHAQGILEAAGYEVLVFHATGSGGRTMEGLISDGYIAGSLDITTTELADTVCGGVFDAGPGALPGRVPRRHPGGGGARLRGHGQLRRSRHRAGTLPRPSAL